MAFILPGYFILQILLPYAIAQTNGNVSVGSTLTAGDVAAKWLSPSGDFAFGFYQLVSDLFLLAIWYNKITNDPIIWHSNEGKPVPRGSKLELNDTLGLVLTNPQGSELWRSIFESGTISHSLINDTGNMALLNHASELLWDSFSNPTDTLVPTQTLELNGTLFSRKSENNFTKGRFQLHLQEDGNFVFNSLSNNSYNPFFSTRTADDFNHTNVGIRVIFDTSGFYILKKSGEKFYIAKPSEGSSIDEYYYKATINYDGVFTISYHPKNSSVSQNWTLSKAMPDNICILFIEASLAIGKGVCGFNSICTLKVNQRPKCACLEGYSLLDSNDNYGGCIPNFEVGCGQQGLDQDQYIMKELPNTDWPLSDYDADNPFSLEDCRNSCLQECSCAADGNSCSKKELPLKFGRRDKAVTGTAFIKLMTTQSNGNLGVGSALTAGNGDAKWLSPSGDFAFGFYQLVSDLFLLAIWYNKITNDPIIWYANESKSVPRGSKLELNDTMGLVLTNPQGSELWRSFLKSGTVSHVLMNDTGNLVLLNQTSGLLWDSFSNPTDTLVPTQTLKLNGTLLSRKSETDFTRGRFLLHLQEDGNFVFKPINPATRNTYFPYFDTRTADSVNHTNVGVLVVFDKLGFLYILKRSGEKFYITRQNAEFSTNEYYYRATINYDGVFTISYHPKDPSEAQNWTLTMAMPDNICHNFTQQVGTGYVGLIVYAPSGQHVNAPKGIHYLIQVTYMVAAYQISK